jgi:hypothetical protein
MAAWQSPVSHVRAVGGTPLGPLAAPCRVSRRVSAPYPGAPALHSALAALRGGATHRAGCHALRTCFSSRTRRWGHRRMGAPQIKSIDRGAGLFFPASRAVSRATELPACGRERRFRPPPPRPRPHGGPAMHGPSTRCHAWPQQHRQPERLWTARATRRRGTAPTPALAGTPEHSRGQRAWFGVWRRGGPGRRQAHPPPPAQRQGG